MLLNTLLSAPPPPASSTNPLQDAGWIGVAVTVFIGFATIISTVTITIWAVRKQRNQKEIMYQVISDVPIANINKAVIDKVEIRFDGKPVTDLRLLVINLWNSGDIAVKPEDFVEPIKFEFEGRTVVSTEILNMEPENIIDPKDAKTFITSDLASTKLSRFLLNPKELISLKVLLTGPREKVRGTARISDGKIIDFNIENQPAVIEVLPLVFISLFWILFLSFTLYTFFSPELLILAIKGAIKLLQNWLILNFNIVVASVLLVVFIIFVIYTIFAAIPKIKKIQKNGVRFRWFTK